MRSYADPLYNDLLDVSGLDSRLPELYEDAAAYPPDEVVAALPVLVELTKRTREHTAATRELIVALDRTKVGPRGGYERPSHWVPHLSLEHGLARRRLGGLTMLPSRHLLTA